MNINYNEKGQLNEILNNNKIINNEWYTISLLAKYCAILKIDMEDALNFIEDKLRTIIPNYSSLTYRNTIKKFLKTFLKRDDVILSDVKKIRIYKDEVAFIEKNVPKENYQKVAFTYLCYRKIRNAAYNKQDTILPIKDKSEDIFKVASMTETGIKAKKILHKLVQDNVLKTMGFYTNEKGELKINLTDTRLDVCNYIKFDGEAAFEVESEDFEKLGLVWLLYKGNKKIKRCEKCNTLLQVKGKERTKYCKTCAKKVNIEKTILNQKKWDTLIC
ncbi:MAG: hypothetical protein ACLR02_12285 [Clostridium sp.]